MDKILIASIVLVLWSLVYRKFHCRNDVRPAFGTELPNDNSLNGCGASLFGGFRVANSDKYVYYIMLTALFLPFVPLGCVVAKKKVTEDALLGDLWENENDFLGTNLVLCVQMGNTTICYILLIVLFI